jgi:hypothetical protein
MILAPSAQAGSYRVVSCGDATGDINNAWAMENTDLAHLEQGSQCSVPSQADEGQLETTGLFSADQLGLSSGSPPGSTASWDMRAPGGTTITALSFRRYLGKRLDDSWSPALSADGAVVQGETCSITGSANGCAVGGSDVTQTEALNAGVLKYGVTCGATSGVCDTGSSLHRVWAALYASTVTISDPVSPTVSAPGGTIASAPPGSFHNATDSITFSASDNVGIRQTTVYVDGQAQSAIADPCDYTFVVPCLQQPGSMHTIDWRSLNLPDGPHQVQVAATDAAGNETRGTTTTVLVDTHPPAAPQVLPAAATQTRPNFTLSWTNPPQGQGAPIARADYLLCPMAGPGSCTAGKGIAADIHQLAVTTPARGHWRLALWLTDAAGNGTFANGATTELVYLSPAALHVTAVQLSGGRLTVSGTTAARGGHVTLTLRVRRSRRPRQLQRSGAIRRGHFHITLRLPPGATPVPGARAVVSFAGDSAHAPQRVSARL